MFQKKTWKARRGVGLNKFSIDGGAPVALVNRPDQIIETGDAFSEENMNDLEERIATAFGTVYGVCIDRDNSNPNTAVTYTDNAIGFFPAAGNDGNYTSGSWSDKFPFNKIRPCIIKNGKVIGYLNPNDYTQFEDGSSADITSGEIGDVMVEIPLFYYKISQDEKFTYVQISDNAMSTFNGFTDKAFRYKGELVEKFYVGAYKGFVDSAGRLRSLSGKTPTAQKTMREFRAAAQANGVGYEQMVFNKLVALQILYLIKYKNLDSQAALGRGYVDSRSSTWTGATDNEGLDYGRVGNNYRVKCNGIEDFWGNINEWVEGSRFINNSLKIQDGNFNNNFEDYVEYPYETLGYYGYLKEIAGNNDLAFTPKALNGSSTTYYTDNVYMRNDSVPFFGGCWNSFAAGAFSLSYQYSDTIADTICGARLLLCRANN